MNKTNCFTKNFSMQSNNQCVSDKFNNFDNSNIDNSNINNINQINNNTNFFIENKRVKNKNNLIIDNTLQINNINGKKIINIEPNGDININANLLVNGFMLADIGQFKNSIFTDNISVLNNITSGNGIFYNNLIASDNNLEKIETNIINSSEDLTIHSGCGHSVNIPNIKNKTKNIKNEIITPCMIKKTKIFIISNDIVLNANKSIDGMEIIIYNESNKKVKIFFAAKNEEKTGCSKSSELFCNSSDKNDLLTEIESGNNKKFLYLFKIKKWIII